ncbi:hypothetical protein PCANC_24917 [Puccinia coronata f. sp. avenae]|uniref:Uncharacterized protein n=1 Tax=Puccinia coronata f. sp. avenae TaxID=200324 RepID=A0A2N5U3M4_9BASI|nr:hypothetical protein PCANC_24917 [Puccinia coronata f. sp. avenae]
MAGRLNHVLYMLPQLCCYLNSLYQMLCSWEYKEALRAVPENVNEDIRYRNMTLLTFLATRLIPNPAPTQIG